MSWLVLALCLVLQVAGGDLLAIRGLSPDLLLLGVVWASRGRAPWQGAALGFLAGLGVDLAGAADPLGASSLAAVSAGYLGARWLPADQRLHPLTTLGRAALGLAPLVLFLAHLRYQGMDYQPLAITVGRALPVWAYTLLLFQVLSWLPGAPRGGFPRRSG
jgi:rod shape-determining protein MreD